MGANKLSLKTIKRTIVGWGGRDRTYECRNQNPVPYHLATPQFINDKNPLTDV